MKTKAIPPMLVATGLAVLAGSGVANAAAWNSDFNMRFYLGAGGGTSSLEPDTSRVPDVNVTDDSDEAAVVTIGVDVSRRVAAELQYADLGAATLTDEATIGYTELSVSGVYYLWNNTVGGGYDDYDGLDLRHGLSLYGRAGLGKMENTATDVAFERANDYQFMAGLGVEYALKNGLAARLEYTAYDKDVTFQGASLLYRFGGSQSPVEIGSEPELPPLPAPEPIQATPPALPELTQPEPEMLPEPEPEPEPQVLDFDADGVADAMDACPSTAAGAPVDSSGCELFNGVIEGVNFERGSATLTALARTTLDEAIATLNAYPGVRISIQAHTDSMGDENRNLELSKQRALAVVRYLTAQGIGIERLEARAYGERRPIADNSTREGRLMNRRVEFRTIR